LASAASDFATLWPEVEAESGRKEKDARKKLAQRGEGEAKALEGILHVQREAIEEALGAQLELELTQKDELDQWRRDKSHLEARRAALEKELKEEPAALAATYEVRLSRLTPVGMVYLWPSSR